MDYVYLWDAYKSLRKEKIVEEYERNGLKVIDGVLKIVRPASNGAEAIAQMDLITTFWDEKMKEISKTPNHTTLRK